MKNYITPQANVTFFPSPDSTLHHFRTTEKRPFTTSEIYDAIFSSAFHAMFYANKDGQILKFNQKFCKLFEYSPSEMQAVSRNQLLDIHDQPFLDFMDERSEKSLAIAEITGVKKSGKRFPCRISSVMYNADYGNKRILNTLVDISDDLSARWDM